MACKTLTKRDFVSGNSTRLMICGDQMRAASQLLEGEPTDVDDAPAPAC